MLKRALPIDHLLELVLYFFLTLKPDMSLVILDIFPDYVQLGDQVSVQLCHI